MLLHQHVALIQAKIAAPVIENFPVLHQRSWLLKENHLFLRTADNFLTAGQNEVI